MSAMWPRDRVEDGGFRNPSVYCADLVGDAHPLTCGVQANRAVVLADGGWTEAALAILSSAAEKLAAAVGPSHPWTIACEHNTAVAQAHAGSVGVAAALQQRAYAKARERLGPRHPLTLECDTPPLQATFWDFEPQPI
jgi:hypothetical protein